MIVRLVCNNYPAVCDISTLKQGLVLSEGVDLSNGLVLSNVFPAQVANCLACFIDSYLHCIRAQ